MKHCPDCTETIRTEARKCQFCGFRFDAPPPAAWPGRIAALGALATIAGGVVCALGLGMLAVAVGAVLLVAGTVAQLVQRRRRIVRRWSPSGSVPALRDVAMLPPLVLPAGLTTLRGHARHAA
jgi:uncharacterized protein UPF0547